MYVCGVVFRPCCFRFRLVARVWFFFLIRSRPAFVFSLVPPLPSLSSLSIVYLFCSTIQVDDSQEKRLDDALENVKKQAFFMKRSLDQDNIRGALKASSLMTGTALTISLFSCLS